MPISAERIVEARDHALAATTTRRCGGPCDLVAITTLSRGSDLSALPDHALGAIGRRGVDEVDAEIDRLKDQPRRFLLGLAGLEAEPGEAAGAEPATLTRRPVRPRVVYCMGGPMIGSS